MDYQTARKFLVKQGTLIDSNTETLLNRLEKGQPPVPGQVTNILLALKILLEQLQKSPELEKELVYPLYLLAYKSRQFYEKGRKSGVNWPPLLDEDLERIATAVGSIFSGDSNSS